MYSEISKQSNIIVSVSGKCCLSVYNKKDLNFFFLNESKFELNYNICIN